MMKRLGLLGLLMLGGCFVGGAIAWTQLTSLPSGYSDNQVDVNAPRPDPSIARQSAQQVEQKLQTLRNPATTVTLGQQEINDVVTATIDSVGRKASITQAIRGVNTELTNGKLKAGAVIDFGKLQSTATAATSAVSSAKPSAEPGAEPSAEPSIVGQVLNRLPKLGNQSVYIGIEGTPKISDGQFQLDPSTRVTIGKLSLSLQDVANYVGVPPEKLQQELNQAIPLAVTNLPVQDINVTDQNLVIRSTNGK
jgi:hypothetical protein